MTQHIDPCETARVRVLAAALALQQCTKTAANIVPIPGKGQIIAIGTKADVARLLELEPAAATTQAGTAQAEARNAALEEAAKVAEDTDVATFTHAMVLHDDGSKTRSDIAAAIRAIKQGQSVDAPQREALKSLALAAGRAKFYAEGFEQIAGRGQFYGGLIMHEDDETIVAQCVLQPWADYIAAANPAIVYGLITEIERLQSASTSSTNAQAAADVRDAALMEAESAASDAYINAQCAIERGEFNQPIRQTREAIEDAIKKLRSAGDTGEQADGGAAQ